MKILYVTTISGTVNAFLIPHIKFLIEQGNEVGVAFNTIQEVSSELIKYGCKIHQIEFQRNPLKKENFTAYKKIYKIVSEEGYELVHVHTPVASFFTRLACRNMKHVKMLYTAHGFHFFKGAPKRNWAIYHTLEKVAARWTDGVITMNNEDFHSAKKLKLRKKNSIYKVHGVGLDLNKFFHHTPEKKNRLRKEYKYNEEDFILIYVGELSYRKHQDLLIEAISKLINKLTNVKLLLVGEGELESDYKELVERLGLEKHVEFLGYRKDIHNLMAISDIAVSTSRHEGLPVNVMEAMATELPLVVTDCRGNRDLVRSGVNGFVIGVDDAEACANSIEKLYHSKELRKEFGEKNRGTIQVYSVENVLIEMKEIYVQQFIEI
jgi:glycosyltransferase EpsD